MTQITQTTAPGDIVIIIPGWVMRLVGFLGLFGGFTVGLLVMMAGYPIEGFVFILFTLVWTPIWMLFHYILWRFYWYLLAATLALQAPLWVGAFLYLISGRIELPRELNGLSVKSNPINGFIALLLAAVITAVLYRIFMLTRGPQQNPIPAPEQVQPAAIPLTPPALTLPEPDLMTRVIQKLEKTGSTGEMRGNNTIHIYKNGQLVGLVRVIDRNGLISPVIVKDVLNQRNRLGVGLAYLATSGDFTTETRTLATQWGVKLMTV